MEFFVNKLERLEYDMIIPLDETFNFEAAVKDHGWWMLSPNHWNEEIQLFYRPVKLSTGKNVVLSVSKTDNYLVVQTENDIFLNNNENQEIKEHVSWVFRVQENFEPFYTMSRHYGELLHVPAERKGRLLRSPTLFEDVVKVILTTNTRWQQTINMANNLVNGLGEAVTTTKQNTFKTFPTPEKVLTAGGAYLKEYVRVGYRSSYILDAATKALDDSFDLESFKSSKRDINELKNIKGVGPYAFNTLSMLLGSYDLLPIDSEYKKHVSNKYFSGGKPSKQELESMYDKWGVYKFLAYWYDM